jgi:hypothetical protein
MRKVLPFFLLILLVGCNTLPYTPIVIVPMNGLYGATNCDQNGNTIVMLDPDRKPTTLIHEQQHVADIRVYPGGCRAFLARYKDDVVFRVQMEARAYCTEMRVGADVSDSLLRLAVTRGLPADFHLRNICQFSQPPDG